MNTEQKELFLKEIFPVAIASCATVLKHDEYKIRHIARTNLSSAKNEPELTINCLKDRFLGTRLGKLLLNPFGYNFSVKDQAL